MIAFLKGNFLIKKPASVIVEVNGVGYEVQISLHTYTGIAEKEAGQLYTYLHLFENGQTLYGFGDMGEKELFLLLISVSGVGASTARMMLSGMRPEEIRKTIAQGNIGLLSTIKGIGKKTAERLILELKEKVEKNSTEEGNTAQIPMIDADVVSALVSLGIAKAAAELAVQKVNATNQTLGLQDKIKQALKNL